MALTHSLTAMVKLCSVEPWRFSGSISETSLGDRQTVLYWLLGPHLADPLPCLQLGFLVVETHVWLGHTPIAALFVQSQHLFSLVTVSVLIGAIWVISCVKYFELYSSLQASLYVEPEATAPCHPHLNTGASPSGQPADHCCTELKRFGWF